MDMQQTSLSPNVLKLRIPSTLADVDEACHRVQCFLRPHHQIRDQFFILLALREALTNAVRHGNHDNPDLSVECLIAVCENDLVITVRDQGDGFAWRTYNWNLPNPESESGRGLAIIKTCFDRMDFNEPGNEITFRKKKYPPDGACMVEVVQNGPQATVTTKKDLVGSRIEVVRQELSNLVCQGITTLVIDLSGVETIDSLGMSLLVATHNSLKAKQGHLSLINVAPKIYTALTNMRLDKHFFISKA